MRHKKKTILIILLCIILITQLLMIPSIVSASIYTQTLKQGIEQFPEEYQSHLRELQELYPNWKFTAYYTGITWNEFINAETSTHLRNTVIKSSNDLWKCSCGQIASGYACSSQSILSYYSDPRNFLNESGIFQFLEMTYNAESQTETGVQGIIASTFMNTSVTFELNGKETTMTYSQIIMEAAKQSRMSPYSIAIKIIQEVGSAGSSSVSGTYVAADGTDYSGYYNFFNYGAYDEGNAIVNGLNYAKEKGWNNQYIAIVEGAKLMANSYTNAGQNTAYFYKWDVVGNESSDLFWHQYMTNIQDPSSQAKSLFNTYAKNNLLDKSLNFIIPVYEGMPTVNNLPTNIDTTLETSYYITGTDVRMRQSASTSSSILAYPEKYEVVTLLEWNAGNANGYEWAKVQNSNGTVGYIANKYLAPCNSKNSDDENNNGDNDNNNNENQTPLEEIARIEGECLIIAPNKTVQEIASYFEMTSIEVKKADGAVVELSESVGTGYTYTINEKTYTAIVLGDSNGSGTVDSLDALKILKYDVGSTTMDQLFLRAADVNKNGSVDSLDALKLLKFDVNLSDITI